ncbi:unnamed protein product [Arabidopsis halleri]
MCILTLNPRNDNYPSEIRRKFTKIFLINRRLSSVYY